MKIREMENKLSIFCGFNTTSSYHRAMDFAHDFYKCVCCKHKMCDETFEDETYEEVYWDFAMCGDCITDFWIEEDILSRISKKEEEDGKQYQA
jgi:hypothetical protein